MEPGEDHELSETMHIRVAAERDSDSDWEDTASDYNTFVRKRRLPSFVRYKHMKVVTPTPVPSTDTSLTSIHNDKNSGRHRRLSSTQSLSTTSRRGSSPRRNSPPRTYTQTMKERLVGKLSMGSIGSSSLSQGLSNFIEHDEGTYRGLGIDLPSAHLTVETETDSRQRKLSTTSGAMLIRVEPEGKSVTFTSVIEHDSSASSLASPSNIEEEGEEEGEGGRGEEGERNDMALHMIARSKSDASAVKSKRAKHHSRPRQKSKCKVS